MNPQQVITGVEVCPSHLLQCQLYLHLFIILWQVVCHIVVSVDWCHKHIKLRAVVVVINLDTLPFHEYVGNVDLIVGSQVLTKHLGKLYISINIGLWNLNMLHTSVLKKSIMLFRVLLRVVVYTQSYETESTKKIILVVI